MLFKIIYLDLMFLKSFSLFCVKHKKFTDLTHELLNATHSVELERARNFFPFSFLRLLLRFPAEKRNINARVKHKYTHLRDEYLPEGV